MGGGIGDGAYATTARVRDKCKHVRVTDATGRDMPALRQCWHSFKFWLAHGPRLMLYSVHVHVRRLKQPDLLLRISCSEGRNAEPLYNIGSSAMPLTSDPPRLCNRETSILQFLPAVDTAEDAASDTLKICPNPCVPYRGAVSQWQHQQWVPDIRTGSQPGSITVTIGKLVNHRSCPVAFGFAETSSSIHARCNRRRRR